MSSLNDNKNNTNQNLPVDGDVIITLNPSLSEAFMIIYAPINGGTDITIERVLDEVKRCGITHGINEENIKQTVHSKNYENQVSIAFWTAPINGENGTIKYRFAKTAEIKPVENEKGFVDYKDLGLIKNITQGTVIADITFPTEGTPGIDIKGNEVKQRPGTKATFGLGSNTALSEDESQIIAAVNGNLVFKGGSFSVETVVTIKSDVDSSVGNIDFLGDVIVKGEVCEGFKVSSMQNITVMGNVTGANIEAGKNVIIKKGCINSKVVAHGNANFGFCEHSDITCDGTINAQTFVICTVYCGESLICKDTRGSLMGGKYTALKCVECANIGSKSYTPTELYLGDNAIITEEKTQHEKEIEAVDSKILRCNQIIDFLTAKKKELHRLPEDKEELLGQSVRSKVMFSMEKKKLLKRISEIEISLQQKQHLTISCKGTVYPGVKVAINDSVFKFESEAKYCKIYLDEVGDIETTSL